MMWENTVSPVERATACAANVMQEIASMSTLKKLKELLGRAREMEAYLKCYCSFCVCNSFLSSGIKLISNIVIIIIIPPDVKASC